MMPIYFKILLLSSQIEYPSVFTESRQISKMICLILQELVKSGIPQSIKIHAREIPVDYQYVMNQFPKICEQLKPDVCFLFLPGGI